MSKLFFKVFLILHPVWLSNLSSDLSINNIVRLGLADTKLAAKMLPKRTHKTHKKWKSLMRGFQNGLIYLFIKSSSQDICI